MGMPPDHEVVAAWQRARTPTEAAEALGVKIQALRNRVKRLRDAGVDLKRYRNPLTGVDVPGLNRAARAAMEDVRGS